MGCLCKLEAVLFFLLSHGPSLEGSMTFDVEVIAVVAVLVFAVKRKETKRIGSANGT